MWGRFFAWAWGKIRKDSWSWVPRHYNLLVSCPEPWTISSWAHSYLGLLGIQVKNEWLKLISVFYISIYYIQKGNPLRHDLLQIWLKLGVSTKIFFWFEVLGHVVTRTSGHHVQDPKQSRVIQVQAWFWWCPRPILISGRW
jgi:hypothetical protein